MAVVRYVALAALVIWLGGTVSTLAGDMFRRLDLVAYACGAVMLIGLLLMKFVGPPPHAFRIRITLVVFMLAITAIASTRGVSRALLTINLGLGFILLSWYARE